MKKERFAQNAKIRRDYFNADYSDRELAIRVDLFMHPIKPRQLNRKKYGTKKRRTIRVF